MNKEHIKEYISKYKDSYSRDSIEKQLLNSGAKQEDIDDIYKEMNSGSIFPPNPKTQGKKTNSTLALVLTIIGFFVPFIGVILSIVGVVLAHKSRTINNKDGIALAALIIGYIGILLSVLSVLLIGALIFSFVDTGDAMLPNMIQLDGALRADSSTSVLSGDELNVVFVYDGVPRITVNLDGTSIKDDSNSQCIPQAIRNVNTQYPDEKNNITFTNGETGVIRFRCDKQYDFGDVFEGEITIATTNAKTAQQLDSKGVIRLKSS